MTLLTKINKNKNKVAVTFGNLKTVYKYYDLHSENRVIVKRNPKENLKQAAQFTRRQKFSLSYLSYST